MFCNLSDTSDAISIDFQVNRVFFKFETEFGKGHISYGHSNNEKNINDGLNVKIVKNPKNPQDFSHSWGTKNLYQFTKAHALCNIVKIKVKENLPLCVSFNQDASFIRFFLAPYQQGN